MKENEIKIRDPERLINELIVFLSRSKNHDEIKKWLDESAERGELDKKKDSIIYQCGDYFIKDGLRYGGESASEVLKALSLKEFRIFPQYVNSISIGDYTVMIYKIPGTEGKDLIDFPKAYNLVSKETKEDAYCQFKWLLDKGLVLRMAARGGYGWYVTAGSKKLISVSWIPSPLEENEDVDEILDSAYFALFRTPRRAENAEKIRCQACGHMINADAHYCPDCGCMISR